LSVLRDITIYSILRSNAEQNEYIGIAHKIVSLGSKLWLLCQ